MRDEQALAVCGWVPWVMWFQSAEPDVLAAQSQITRGLLQKYGPERVKDTPITEVGWIAWGACGCMSRHSHGIVMRACMSRELCSHAEQLFGRACLACACNCPWAGLLPSCRVVGAQVATYGGCACFVVGSAPRSRALHHLHMCGMLHRRLAFVGLLWARPLQA